MKKRTKNRGFTLVELIVVLVILAILAAILVPSLLGYIDQAKERKNMLNAKNVLTATQTALASAYANGTDLKSIHVSNRATSDWTGTKFADEILSTADDKPYMAIVGLGRPNDENNVTPEEKRSMYTVYYVVYWQDEKTDPIFFDGSGWSMDYPWVKDGNPGNHFMVNGVDTKMSFYFINAPKQKDSDNWNHLKAYLRNHGRTRYGGGKL